MEVTFIELCLSIRSWGGFFGILDLTESLQPVMQVLLYLLYSEGSEVQSLCPRSGDLTSVRLGTRLLISMSLNFLIYLQYLYFFAQFPCMRPVHCPTHSPAATFLAQDPIPHQATAVQPGSEPPLGCCRPCWATCFTWVPIVHSPTWSPSFLLDWIIQEGRLYFLLYFSLFLCFGWNITNTVICADLMYSTQWIFTFAYTCAITQIRHLSKPPSCLFSDTSTPRLPLFHTFTVD